MPRKRQSFRIELPVIPAPSRMVDAYLEAADFTTHPEERDDLIAWDIATLSDKARTTAAQDCAAFLAKAGKLPDTLTPESLGHDFWLTRNHHGAGFWDRGLGELGDRLTKLADSFGSQDLVLGDDGFLHLEPT